MKSTTNQSRHIIISQIPLRKKQEVENIASDHDNLPQEVSSLQLSSG